MDLKKHQKFIQKTENSIRLYALFSSLYTKWNAVTMTDEMKNDGFFFLRSVLKLSGHVFIDSIRSFSFAKFFCTKYDNWLATSAYKIVFYKEKSYVYNKFL